MGSTPSRGATRSVPGIGRWGPAVVALLLTLVLAWFLPKPGYTTVRLAYFAVVAGVAWVGATGAALGRPTVVVASAALLFLLGFWQAVLWIAVLPAALLQFGAALLLRTRGSGRSPAAE